MTMEDHDFILKDLDPYPVPGMTNENHENISVRTASLWAKLLNPRPHKSEEEALST
jgi:hypothetical protein